MSANVAVIKQADDQRWKSVAFSRPARATVSEKGARKSTIAIQCQVTTRDGLIVNTAMWAGLKRESGQDVITFEASMPREIGTVDDDTRESFLAFVEHAAVKWNGYDNATAAAEGRLTGTEVKAAIPRPRLVKAIKVGNN